MERIYNQQITFTQSGNKVYLDMERTWHSIPEAILGLLQFLSDSELEGVLEDIRDEYSDDYTV